MEPQPQVDFLTLPDAVQRWCDPSLVTIVLLAQLRCTRLELFEMGHPDLAHEDRHIEFAPNALRAAGGANPRLDSAWAVVDHDFKSRVERGELYLTGVRMKAEMDGPREAISGVLAAHSRINYLLGTVSSAQVSYANVQVSTVGPATDSGASELPPGKLRLQVSDVADLDDETILALLSEHIDRVVESPEPKMMARIKDVLQPIIVRRLEIRARRGELADTLNAEARALASWIGKVASWHPTPAAKTVENNIRDRYKALKPRSKAMI